ncbi:hypothetical protein NDK43_06920 [Neobacillus pocheonensis]|uniref:Uncharacterized protein n=1 Tax=Neobacillus pocheonensis TaxID=363869 RepID=A0ABT0W9C8_9BACI|nr:hypothetical protein [Neobacillus pocheonensis]
MRAEIKKILSIIKTIVTGAIAVGILVVMAVMIFHTAFPVVPEIEQGWDENQKMIHAVVNSLKAKGEH